MKITAVKQQQKRADRYSIYVDGSYAFSFSEAELLRSGIAVGDEFDSDRLRELQDRANQDKAYERVLNLLSYRPRSEWELRDYLRRKDYTPPIQELIIARLKKAGYVNDEEFARRWVENRRMSRPISKLRLRQELKQKRIAEDIVSKVLANDEVDEVVIVKDMIERKRLTQKYTDTMKLKQYLARQGFRYDTITTALNDLEGN